MIIYAMNDRIAEYQPDRRKQNVGPPTSMEDRRKSTPITTTSEQYSFLKDSLVRREALQNNVAKRGRLIRHVLVSITLAFIAIFFAAPDFKISLIKLGIDQELTLLQLSAIAPLIIAYLVLHACHVGVTRLRLIHECKVIEVELERFGCETSYSLFREYGKECQGAKQLYHDLVSTKAFFAVYSLHDFFIFISVFLAFIGATYVAAKAYTSVASENIYAAIGFTAYLVIAILAAIFAVLALRYARIKKDEFLDDYLLCKLPPRLQSKETREC